MAQLRSDKQRTAVRAKGCTSRRELTTMRTEQVGKTLTSGSGDLLRCRSRGFEKPCLPLLDVLAFSRISSVVDPFFVTPGAGDSLGLLLSMVCARSSAFQAEQQHDFQDDQEPNKKQFEREGQVRHGQPGDLQACRSELKPKLVHWLFLPFLCLTAHLQEPFIFAA